ncbi:MAG TPA: M17 family peptidase N-terminal domain-containing protein, partial [Marinobacter sp.]|nr:M17 family peptidase N-terminal domain-containing protein [Marinobacter sp.]
MNFSLSSKAITATKTDCLVIGLPEKGEWPDTTKATDEALGGLIKQLEKAGDLTGKNASVNTLPLVDQPWQRVIVLGTGKDSDRTAANFRKALIAMMGALKDGPSKNALICLADTALQGEDAVSNEEARLNLIGRILEDQLYSFTGFKSEKPAARKLKKVTVQASGAGKALKDAFNLGLSTGRGMNFTKDLGNTPPNICHPVWLAEQAQAMAKEHDCIKTEVLDEKQMEKMGMNTILAVGKGSKQPPRLIVM